MLKDTDLYTKINTRGIPDGKKIYYTFSNNEIEELSILLRRILPNNISFEFKSTTKASGNFDSDKVDNKLNIINGGSTLKNSGLLIYGYDYSINIEEADDEWYYVWFYDKNQKIFSIFYKCDQFEGLVELLTDWYTN